MAGRALIGGCHARRRGHRVRTNGAGVDSFLEDGEEEGRDVAASFRHPAGLLPAADAAAPNDWFQSSRSSSKRSVVSSRCDGRRKSTPTSRSEPAHEPRHATLEPKNVKSLDVGMQSTEVCKRSHDVVRHEDSVSIYRQISSAQPPPGEAVASFRVAQGEAPAGAPAQSPGRAASRAPRRGRFRMLRHRARLSRARCSDPGSTDGRRQRAADAFEESV